MSQPLPTDATIVVVGASLAGMRAAEECDAAIVCGVGEHAERGRIRQPNRLRTRRQYCNAAGCSQSGGAVAAELRTARQLAAYAADVSECFIQLVHVN